MDTIMSVTVLYNVLQHLVIKSMASYILIKTLDTVISLISLSN